MAYSRLKSQNKTRPLTARDVITESLKGYSRRTRKQNADRIYGALLGKGLINE